MLIIQNIISIAEAEVGTKEIKQNEVKYNNEYYNRKVNGENYHWCAYWWVFKHAKALYALPEIDYIPNVNSFKSGFESSEIFTDISKAEIGDITFINYNSPTPHHMAIVVEPFNGEYIVTIEGNTSASNAIAGIEGDRNGDGVYKKKRSVNDSSAHINSFARPRYFSSPLPNVGQPMPDFPLPSGWVFAKGGYQSYNGITDDWGPYIEYIQEALNITADGRFGEATHQAVLAFQAQKGLSQDGKVGKNTWNALREKRDGTSGSGDSGSGYDDGSTYTGAFKLPSGHCYGKLGIAYASQMAMRINLMNPVFL